MSQPVLALVFSIFSVISNGWAAGVPGKHTPILFPPLEANSDQARLPGRVQLLEPAYMAQLAQGPVTLRWQAAENADVYHVQVAKDPAFKWLVKNEQNVQGTSLEVSELEQGNNYWWRVAARKPANDPKYTKGFFSRSSFRY